MTLAVITLAAAQHICLLLLIAFVAGALAGGGIVWIALHSPPATDADPDYGAAG